MDSLGGMPNCGKKFARDRAGRTVKIEHLYFGYCHHFNCNRSFHIFDVEIVRNI